MSEKKEKKVSDTVNESDSEDETPPPLVPKDTLDTIVKFGRVHSSISTSE